MRKKLLPVPLALLAAVVMANPAQAQAVKDFDGVSDSRYDSQETDTANQELSRIEAEYDPLEIKYEQMTAGSNELDYEMSEIGDVRDRMLELDGEFDAAEEDLAEARYEAIKAEPLPGTPEGDLAELRREVEALTTLEEWSTDKVGSEMFFPVTDEIQDLRDAHAATVERLENPPAPEQQPQQQQVDPGSSQTFDEMMQGYEDEQTTAGATFWSVVRGALWVLALIVAGIVAALVFGVRWWVRSGRRVAASRVEYAMTQGGMHTLDPDAPGSLRHVNADPVGGLTDDREQWMIQDRVFKNPMAAALAGPGSGKTQTISIPTAYNVLVAQRGHLVCVDPKPEIMGYLVEVGAVEEAFVYDFRSDRTSPTSAINVVGTPGDARAFFEALIAEPNAKDPYFSQAAIDLADAVAAALDYPDLITVFETVRRPKRLDALAEKDEEVSLLWADLSDKTRSSILSTFQTKFGPLRNPKLREIFETHGAQEPEFGAEYRDVVFIIPPTGEGEAKPFGPLIAAVLDTLYRRAVAAYARAEVKTYYVVEEAASTLKLEFMGNYINSGRGKGQRILSVFQSISQLEDRMGSKAAAQNIIGSCAVQLFGNTPDYPTAKAISEFSGTVRVGRQSTSESENDEGDVSTSTSYSTEERPRLKPEHVMGLKQFVFYSFDGDPSTITEIETPPWFRYKDRLKRPAQPFQQLGIPQRPVTPPQRPTQPPETPPVRFPKTDAGRPTQAPQRPEEEPVKGVACEECTQPLPPHALYCPSCGHPVEELLEDAPQPTVCVRCEHENRPGLEKCEACRWPLNGGDSRS